MQFNEKVAIYNMSHLSPWRKEMGAMAANPRMVALHNPVLAIRRDAGAKEHVRKCGTCKRWWGDPGYRVSHVSVTEQNDEEQLTFMGGYTHQDMHLIQHMHSSTGGRLGVIPLKRAFSE